MPTLAIMIGIQGSGKSTFCSAHLPEYEHISLDDLKTRNKENMAIQIALQAGRDIVIDNTNPTVQDRKKYIDLAKVFQYRTEGYFMQSRVQDCIIRNDRRTGKARVPEMAIAATSNRLEVPSLEEGFDKLFYVSIAGDVFEIKEWRE